MDDAEARDDRATPTSYDDVEEPADGDQPDRSGVAEEPLDDDQPEPSGLASEEPDLDADAVVIEEVTDVRADDSSPAPASPEAARHAAPTDDDVRDNGVVGDREQLYQRWSVIQASFVDDPQGSVTAAAELVTETISTLVASAQERERGLRGEWDREGVDTEGLRNVLRGYRRFLEQLAAR
jgi:hypothetical protein